MPRVRFLRPASFTTTFQRITSAFVIVVVVFNVYRRLFIDTTDPYKCSALLAQGQWVDTPDRNPEQEPFLNWQVPGCLLHEYQSRDIARCAEGGKILFVGDTGTRQVFWAAVRRLEGGNQWVDGERVKRDVHIDLEYSRDGATLKFLWDPYLNSSQLRAELMAFQGHGQTLQKAGEDGGDRQEKESNIQKSALIFIGGGLWYARHVHSDPITHYKDSVDRIISMAYGENSSIGIEPSSPIGREGVGNQLFFAPVLEPLYDELSPSRALTIVPSKINAMNKYLAEQADSGLNVLWSFPKMTRDWPEVYGASGLHVSRRVASRMADVALNVRCNAKASQREGYPFNKSCCTPYRPFNWLQILGIIASVVVLQELVYKAVKGTAVDPINPGKDSELSITSRALPAIVLTIAYCFLADRTQVFDKHGKEFSNLDFRVLLGLTIVPCLWGIKSIPVPEIHHSSNSKAFVSRPFLPRELTEEFKGWMQLYVLIYGYTGADVYLDFYEVLRVFLALYLLFSGYGHTMYFLQTRDYSLQRVAIVLLRLNTFPVLLSFGMATPYSSYYFAPLISFWFLVVFITLRTGEGRNRSLRYIVMKIIVSTLLLTCLINLEGVLESICSILNLISRGNINIEEWKHHLGTDRYIVFVGMLVAVLNLHLTSILNTPEHQLGATAGFIHTRFELLSRLAILIAVITVPVWWVVTREIHNKDDYNWWLPYISWLPAVSFIVLRNGTRFFRTYYCAPLAWISRISLELYLLSKHIWLVGDGWGLLRVGFRNGDGSFFGDRWRDLLVLTPIFVWAAWKVSDATKMLSSWIMGMEQQSGDEAATANQGIRDEMEMSSMDYRNTLPKPSTQSHKAERPKTNDHRLGMPTSLRKRLLFVAAIVWIGNILYT